jgi:hypothetical protein
MKGNLNTKFHDFFKSITLCLHVIICILLSNIIEGGRKEKGRKGGREEGRLSLFKS